MGALVIDRRALCIFALILFVGCGGYGENGGLEEVVAQRGHPGAVKVPGFIVVDFVDGTSESELEAWQEKWGVNLEFNSKVGHKSGVAVAQFDGDKWSLIDRVRGYSNVEAAEPLYLYEHAWQPNDPSWHHQWNMKKVGAAAAWERSTGRGVVVAVIDTGIAYADHEGFRQVEDLVGARIVPGWDFVNGRRLALDDHGHGTHVAGTIAQRTNNRIGVAGLAHNSSLMPIKVLSASGTGTSADIADAIRFATDNGAHVINLSLGGRVPSGVIARAVAHARRKGVLVVAAAGNSGRRGVSYPAAFPGVMAVSATRFDDALAFYSSYGPQVVLAAPGGDMTVDQSGDGKPDGILQNTIARGNPGRDVYERYQGTSMATPHVAASAALVMSIGFTEPLAVKRVLFDTARPGSGQTKRDERYGHGVVDAGAAVFRAWRELVVGRASWLMGFVVLLALVFRRRLPPLRLTPAFFGLALLTGVGLFFLPWLLPRFEGRELLTLPWMEWGLLVFGPGRHANPLTWSAIIPLALSVPLFMWRRARSALAGISIGAASFLFHASFSDHASLLWLPGPLGTAWLVGNGALAFLLAFALTRKEAR